MVHLLHRLYGVDDPGEGACPLPSRVRGGSPGRRRFWAFWT